MDMHDSLDISPLKKALAALENSLKVLENPLYMENTALSDTVRAGVIQNFEICYELSVKMLRRRLVMDSDSAAETVMADFKTILRLGGAKGLIDPVENWFEYRKRRNVTYHTYDQGRADEVLAAVPDFVRDARFLLEALMKAPS